MNDTEGKMPSGRGVVYMKWGTTAEAPFQRSLASIKQIHPELSVHVVQFPPQASLLDKAAMFEQSPFEETLFLDVDTVVMDRLDFGFEKAEKFGLACCVCECPWARRYSRLSGDMIEYNTGVLFFTRQMQPLFDAWKINNATRDSSIPMKSSTGQISQMPYNDQAGFARAIEDLGICPYILPLNWNFRPIWQHVLCGPLKIWHDYKPVPPQLYEWTHRQKGDQRIIEFIRVV